MFGYNFIPEYTVCVLQPFGQCELFMLKSLEEVVIDRRNKGVMVEMTGCKQFFMFLSR